MLPYSFLLLLIPLKTISLWIASTGTLSGKIKPHRVSLLLWSLPPLIGFSLALKNGAFISALPLLFAGLGPLIILLLTFITKQEHWKIHRGDYVSGILSIITIILWIIFYNPVAIVFLAIIADFFASLPTMIKAWNHPETESFWIYLITGLGSIVGLLTLKVWSLPTAGFSIYLIILSSIMFGFITHKKNIEVVRKCV